MLDSCKSHRPGDGSFWVFDGCGIHLARVCSKCKAEKLSKYRPEILEPYKQSDVDEPIEDNT